MMTIRKINVLLFSVLLGASTVLHAQTARPFENEVTAFEAQDRQSPPPANGILFVGSSSIRLWDSLRTAFPGQPIIQRGIGGGEISDMTRYMNRMIVNYRPRQIIFYAGENDIAVGGQSANQVYNRFVGFFTLLRKMLPNTQFTFVSLKPSPARRQFQATATEVNRLIRQYLGGQRNTLFLDVATPMMGANGQPRPELFRPDSLHLNPRGYALWAEQIRPVLR